MSRLPLRPLWSYANTRALRPRHRPPIEPLENRWLFAVIPVTTTFDLLNDNDGLTSLREAIDQANSGDTILLTSGTYTLTRVNQDGPEDENFSGDLDINKSLKIQGADPLFTIIDGNGADRVFDVIGANAVEFSRVTIRNGRTAEDGGGIRGTDGAKLTLTESVVTGNRAAAGGGISILSDVGGSLAIVASTISANTATSDGGGIFTGVFTEGADSDIEVNLLNSTVSGNVARNGGGIFVTSEAFLRLTYVTVSDNTAFHGGGILNFGTSDLLNTIVAVNHNTAGGAAPDLAGEYDSIGHNLIGNTAGSTGFLPAANGNLLNINPRLGPLADNGGFTPTHALLAFSPAFARGQATPLTSVDQRGVSRIQGATPPDIGAYETRVIALCGQQEGLAIAFSECQADIARLDVFRLPLHQVAERKEFLALAFELKEEFRATEPPVRVDLNVYLKNLLVLLREHWRVERRTGVVCPFEFPDL